MGRKRKELNFANEQKILRDFAEIQQFILKPDISTDQKLKSYIKHAYLNEYGHKSLLPRFISSAKNLEDEGVAHVKRIISREDSDYYSARRTWYEIAVINREFPSINLQSENFTPYISAAIYILDQIKKAGRTRELMNLLNYQMPLGEYPEIDDLRESVEKCTLNSKHAIELIIAVAELICDRNISVSGFKESYTSAENFLNKQIVLGKHIGADNVNRKLFEDVIALIPEKKLKQSITRTKNNIWKCIDIYIQFFAYFENYLYERVVDTDAQIESVVNNLRKRESFNAKKKIDPKDLDELTKNIHSSVHNQSRSSFALQQSGISRESSLSEMSIGNIMMKGRKATDSVNSIIVIRNCQRHISLLLNRLFKMSFESFMELESIHDIPDVIIRKFREFDVNQLTVAYPEELIFSVIYMLDQNIDEAFLLPATSMLFDILMYSLPWAGGKKHKSSFHKKKLPKEIPAFIQDFVDKKTYIDVADSHLSRVNMGHMLWHLCGRTAPLNVQDYLNKYKYIKDYDIPDDYKSALAFAAAMVTTNRASESESEMLSESGFILGNVEDDNNPQDEIDDVSSKEQFNKIIRNYIQKNKNLIIELKREKSKSRQISEENEQLKEQLKSLKQDLEIMKLVQETDDDFDEKSEGTYAYPYELKHRYAVFGGYDKLISGMSEYFEDNVVFDTDTKTNRFEKEYVRKSDVVCILIKNIGHSVYYSIMDEAKRYGKELMFINCRNNELMAKAIINKDRQLCQKETEG